MKIQASRATIVALVICAQLAPAASAVAELIQLNEGLAARRSMNFIGTQNRLGILPSGTIGNVVNKVKLRSGNYGYQVRIVDIPRGGPASVKEGDVVWLYYHTDPSERKITALNDAGKQVEDPEAATQARADTTFQAPLTLKTTQDCVKCTTQGPVEPAKATPGLLDFQAILKRVKEIEAIPILDPTVEELTAYINRVKPKQPQTNRKIAQTVIKHCKQSSPAIPVALVLSIMEQESQYNPNARSKAGAKGLMQLMVGSYDIDKNVGKGVRMLSRYHRMYDGDVVRMLKAYNTGEGNLAKIEAGTKRLPGETKDFIEKVYANLQDYQDAAEVRLISSHFKLKDGRLASDS